jgi:hypothetical protein
VTVGEAVGDAEADAVGTGVSVLVGAAVFVGVAASNVAVAVRVRVALRSAVGDVVGVGLAVRVAGAVPVGDAVRLGLTVRLRVGVAVSSTRGGSPARAWYPRSVAFTSALPLAAAERTHRSTSGAVLTPRSNAGLDPCRASEPVAGHPMKGCTGPPAKSGCASTSPGPGKVPGP